MGNSKSRQAHPGHSRKSKHLSTLKQPDLDPPQDYPSPQPLLNDSGHYSTHGSVVAPARSDFPGGSFHPNLSSPGRLDQQKKASDSSLQLQYGSRVKRAVPSTSTANDHHLNSHQGPNSALAHPSNNIGPGGIRSSAVGSRLTPIANAADSAGHGSIVLNSGSQDMPNPGDIRPTSTSPWPSSQQRMSSYIHPSTSQQQQQQQQQQQLHPGQHASYQRLSASPSATGHINDLSLTGASISMNEGRGSLQQPHRHLYPQQPGQQQLQQQQQQQQQLAIAPNDLPYVQRLSSLPSPSFQQGIHVNGQGAGQGTGSPMNNHYSQHQPTQQSKPTEMSAIHPSNSDPRMRNDFVKNTFNSHQPAYPNYTLHSSNNNNINNNNTYNEPPRPNPTKASNVFAGAGPLIDAAPSNRPLTADQVFARLARQYPTNPRETDKRERVYRWLDEVTSALTFNPDTETPGYIIRVEPDELDKADSPFYVDRVTYELDLMAPVGKVFRKAIDINCASGEWAMDIALKYPKTIVYALDPRLDHSRLPLRIPDNCKFKQRDVKEQEGEFDLVHQRLGTFRTLIRDWTPHFAELGRLTRPGGWIQLAESNGMIIRAGVESFKVNRWVEQAALSTGLNPIQLVDALMPTILGAGLINVECYEYGIPLGSWGGRRGMVAMMSYLNMIESLKDEIIEINRLEEGIFEETIGLMRMECEATSAELIMKVICAQKPPITDDLRRG